MLVYHHHRHIGAIPGGPLGNKELDCGEADIERQQQCQQADPYHGKGETPGFVSDGSRDPPDGNAERPQQSQ